MNQILVGQRFDDQSSMRFKNLGDYIGKHASIGFHRTIALQAGSSAAIRQVSTQVARVLMGFAANLHETARILQTLRQITYCPHESYSQLTQLAIIVVPADPRCPLSRCGEEVEHVGVVHGTDSMEAQHMNTATALENTTGTSPLSTVSPTECFTTS